MRKSIFSLIAALLVGLLGVSQVQAAKANKADKKDKKGAAGVIRQIEGKTPTLTLTIAAGKGKKAKTSTITTDAKTSVMVDGQAKTLADLRVGENVKMNTGSGLVSTIDASTKVDGKDKKNKKAQKTN